MPLLTSSSVTSRPTLPSAKPPAVAVSVTAWVPSARLSSTPLTVTWAELWPSRMVTLAGSVASPGSLLRRLTVRSPAVPVLRPTVSVAVPPFSPIVAVSRLRLSAGELPPLPARLPLPPSADEVAHRLGAVGDLGVGAQILLRRSSTASW